VSPPAHRRLLLVTGDRAWGEAWVTRQLVSDDFADTLWIASTAGPGIAAVAARKAVQHLGGECRLLVVDAHQGFNPDAFAAALGTLRGGGDCVVLAPALADWPSFDDPDKARFAAYPHEIGDMRGHFLARLCRLWRDAPGVHIVMPQSPVTLRMAPPAAVAFHLSDDQAAAVAAVERVARGHARRPLVLTADRGRGKSTVLGVAAARLLTAGLPRITVVAPHRTAAATLFRHAMAHAGQPLHEVADVQIGAGQLCFRLPADCLAEAPGGPGLVMVDEAAAIPVGVLAQLLEHHNRLVFASTVHGYEGSGRGFELRFRSTLDRLMPQWRSLQLTQPLRWAADDPLEALLNRAFVLDADLEDLPDERDADVWIDRVDQRQLAADEPLLRRVFGLLVNAHYQTRPSDLRQLLDNPDVHLWLARRGGLVAGVLLAITEGGFDAPMVAKVLNGGRRPRGHLLAQSLAVHAGLDACLGQRVLRIQRIAVHPALRRRGIGGLLVNAVAQWGSANSADLLGCTFGIERSLLDFWQAAGFAAVRLGVRIDPASAAHSVFMLRGLGERGRALTREAGQRFLAALPWTLGAGLRDLDSHLASLLLQGRDCADLSLTADDVVAIERIAGGARQPATADAILWRAVVRLAASGNGHGDGLALLVAWQLQHRTAAQICAAFAVCGRDALEDHLRNVLAQHRNIFLSSG
jgi:tRNA(Met) cytidine acetyltransferase